MSTKPVSRIAWFTLAVLPLFACSSTPSKEREVSECELSLKPGPSPLRRLTRVEYNNTIYQLFDDNSQPANAFPPDEEAGGFDNQAEALVVSPLLAENYLSAAESLAATHTPNLMQRLPNCQGDSVDEASCAGDAEV